MNKTCITQASEVASNSWCKKHKEALKKSYFHNL